MEKVNLRDVAPCLDAAEKLFALFDSGKSISIAEATERTGMTAEMITIILAIAYAMADELLKRLDPSGQSLH